MKVLIILGNTREKSNTEAVARLVGDELSNQGVEVVYTSLRDKKVQTCVGCYLCHSVYDSFGCVIDDDVKEIADVALTSDLIVLTSPIYSWMPTPPLKAIMDRFYAFTKYRGDDESFNLLKKQKFAMIATSGDAVEKNCDLFDEAVRRMANFANLPYLGYLAALDQDVRDGMTDTVKSDVKNFAEKCIAAFR